MDDLLRWYGQQLDEDERIARATDQTLGQRNLQWSVKPMDAFCKVVAAGFYVVGTGEFNPEDALHIAEHDPARVLREIEADRALIADYVSAQKTVDAIAHPDMYDVGRAQGLEEAVRRRVSAYDQRPGYREEWRP